MDPTQIVSYEREFPLKILHPATGAETDIVMMIRHADCSAAEAVTERQSARAAFGLANRQERVDRYAACIAGWENLDFDGKKNVPFSPDTARHVLSHPGAKWLLDQVVAGCNNIENFTSD